MRALIATLLALLITTAASAADLKVVRVWPGYRTAESFDRIAEYFTGEENTPGQTMLRTQPAAREGYYFLTRLKNAGPELTGARIELNVITPFSADPKKYTFTCLIPSGNKVYNIGLTGTDWPADAAKKQAVAWQIRVLSTDGAELAREQSFLWDKPSK